MARTQTNIGIFGGSFDPVHLGHLIMAQDAEEAFALDRVLFVPAMQPPHKLSRNLVTPDQRMDMLRLALGERRNWEVSDVEVRRGGVSYSIDTVRHFAAVYPEAKLFLIIGGDTLPEFPTWKEVDALLDVCRIITMVRPGFDAVKLHAAIENLPARHRDNLARGVVTGHAIDISSTGIRMRVAQKRPIGYLVPEVVEHYIGEHGLYRQEGIAS
jgi:nicotinate-nucleotide adenylyltransferase